MKEVLIFLLILSQLLTGVYSWLVKTVPTNLSTQLLVRMLTFTGAAFSMAHISGKSFAPSLSHLLSMGSLNALHIFSSFYAYSQLPTTVSVPLFYIYPLINVLLSTLILKTPFQLNTLPWLLCSFIGTILIVFQKGAVSFSPSGIVSILVAAIAESLIYIVYKSKFEPNIYEIEIDNKILDQDVMLLSVANGECYGGGMRICPGASNSDGVFDILVVRPVSKLVLLTIFPKVFNLATPLAAPTLLASNFKSNAACVAVDTGLLISLVLFTLPKSMSNFDIFTEPV